MSTIRHDTPDTVLDSVSALSLLVFSVALMAYLLFFQPLLLLLEGKQKESLAFFLKTLGTFGGITIGAIATSLLILWTMA